MEDFATMGISNHIQELGINISALSRGTGIPDGILRRSIVRNERALRADEMLSICNFLGKNPLEFYRAGLGTSQDSV